MSTLNQAIQDSTEILDAFDTPHVFRRTVHFPSIPPLSAAYFTVVIERSRLPDIYEEVTRWGYYVPEPLRSSWLEDKESASGVAFCRELGSRNISIDFFFADTAGQKELIAHRGREPFEGISVWQVGQDDELLLKLTECRYNVADIRCRLRHEAGLNLSYLREWAERLGLLDKFELALQDDDNSELED
ncbi:MAG: hypothetical protein ACKVP0_07260 [Pirellulaceae bacterium]